MKAELKQHVVGTDASPNSRTLVLEKTVTTMSHRTVVRVGRGRDEFPSKGAAATGDNSRGLRY